MLNTADFEAAIQTLPAPKRGKNAKKTIANAWEYHDAIHELMRQWQEYLEETYAQEYHYSGRTSLFRLASEKSEKGDYQDMEDQYAKLVKKRVYLPKAKK